MWDSIGAKNGEREKTKHIGNDIKRENVCEKDETRVEKCLWRKKEGSMEEERRDGEAVRRETWTKNKK